MRALKATLAASALLALGAPAAGQGATLLGSHLATAPIQGVGGPITAIPTTIPGATLTITAKGVLTRYRVRRQNFAWGDVALRVLRPVGGGNLDGVGTSDVTNIPTGPANTFELPAQLPVLPGDRIGIDASLQVEALNTPSAGYDYFSPRLTDSALPATPLTGFSGYEIAFNADLEADADGDGFGDETQDSCPTSAAVHTACPTRTPHKKCKKAKKKRSGAAAAKKKGCKKKRKK